MDRVVEKIASAGNGVTILLCNDGAMYKGEVTMDADTVWVKMGTLPRDTKEKSK